MRGCMSPSTDYKLLKLHEFVTRKDTDIIFLTEWSTQRFAITQQGPNKYVKTKYDKKSKTYKSENTNNPFKIFKHYTPFMNISDNAILVKKSLKPNSVKLIPPQSPDKFLTKHLHATAVNISINRKSYFFMSYYNSPTHMNSTKSHQLFTYINQLPSPDHILCAGDMNIHHIACGDVYNDNPGTHFIDKLEDEGYFVHNNNHGSTHIAGGVLDLIIGSPSTINKIHSINIHKTWIESNNINSDHYPITATYKISQNKLEPPSYPSWNLNSGRWDEYTAYTEKYFQPIKVDKSIPIQTQYNLFELRWREITSNTIGIKYIIHKTKPWWNKTIKNLVKQTRKLYRKITKLRLRKRSIPQKLNNKYKLTRNKRSNKIRQAKRYYIKRVNEILEKKSTSSKAYWRAIDRFATTTKPDIPTLINNIPDAPFNKTVTSLYNKLKLLHYFYTHPPQPTIVTPTHDQHYSNVNKWYKTIDKHFKLKYNVSQRWWNNQMSKTKLNYSSKFAHSHNTSQLNYQLNKPIDIHELNKSISELDNDKAMGPDNIHNQMIKRSGPNFRTLLLEFFNYSLESGTQPIQWQKDSILPIPKPKKDHQYPQNYRPIAISSTVGRLLQKILAKRLQFYCYKLGFFDKTQSGFQINRSTTDAIIPLYLTMIKAQNIKSFTNLLKTDFSKAYDTVWHHGLMYKLVNNLNISGPILKWLNNFLTNRYTNVQYNRVNTPWQYQNIGVPQGSSLSPILYIIYTMDYTPHPSTKKSLNKGCFADDTIFWNHHQSNPNKINKIFHTEFSHFCNWCTKWKLVINPCKCSSMTINPNLNDNSAKIQSPNIPLPDENISSHIPDNDSDDSSKLNANVPLPNNDTDSDYDSDTDATSSKDIHKYTNNIIEHHNRIHITHKNPFKYKYNITSEDTYKTILHNNYSKIKSQNNMKYLGLLFNNQGQLKDHLLNIKRNQYYELNKLYTLLYLKIFLPCSTIQMIYRCKARTQFEYACIIHSKNKRDRKDFQIIQNKFLRFALNANRTTPIPVLHFLLNEDYIEDRYEYYIAKHVLRTLYAVPNHPLFSYKNEIDKYNKSKSKHPNTFNRYIPFNKGIKILRKYNHPITQIKNVNKISPQPFTSLPIYEIPIPHILKIFPDEVNNDKPFPIYYDVFYCDGSNKPNPGKGGHAFTLIYSAKKSFKTPYSHKYPNNIHTTIDLEELESIINILLFIQNNYTKMSKWIAIQSDSLNSIQYLSREYYPTTYIQYNKIQFIYLLIHKLSQAFGINLIRIGKVKGHGHSKYNEYVDKKANEARKQVTLNKNEFNKIPFAVSLALLKQQIYFNQVNRWKQYCKNKHAKNESTILTRNFEFPTKKLKKALNNLFNYHDRGIIVNILTNHTKTNMYYKRYNFDPSKYQYNNGLCIHCDTPEDINHIIYYCVEYMSLRREYFATLKHMNNMYEDPLILYKIDYLLLPCLEPISASIDNITDYWKPLLFFLRKTNHNAFNRDIKQPTPIASSQPNIPSLEQINPMNHMNPIGMAHNNNPINNLKINPQNYSNPNRLNPQNAYNSPQNNSQIPPNNTQPATDEEMDMDMDMNISNHRPPPM